MRTSEPLTKNLDMFVAVLFIPVVAGNLFTESSLHRFPEITERSGYTKTYMIFDPCNINKPGGRIVSCSQLQMMGHNKSGKYVINPDNENITVYCDMKTDGGGWTVIQRREKHEISENLFDKTFQEYEDGFGDAMGSYWIEYDALAFTNGRRFVIGNITNTYHSGNCYALRSGGWWSSDLCTFANLNGHRRDPTPGKPTPTLDITWFRGLTAAGVHVYIFGKVEMKIRDADFDFCTGRMASYSP